MYVVDASVWVARYLPQDAHHDVASRWIIEILSNKVPILAPTILLPEVAGPIARRTGTTAPALSVASELVDLPGVSMIPLDLDMSAHGARLAAELRLTGADAVYVALAAASGGTLVTLDSQLRARSSSVVTVTSP